MSTTRRTLPPELDPQEFPGDVLEAYELNQDEHGEPVRVAVVTYDYSPEPPMMHDHGCTWAWVEGAPWWTSGGSCDPFDVEDTPAGAVAFAVEEQRDGGHYYPAFPGGIRPAGYIIPPPGCAAEYREQYVAGILADVTAWATGDVYMVDVLERVTWERKDGGDERTTWEPWNGLNRGFYGIEAARQYVAEEYGA